MNNQFEASYFTSVYKPNLDGWRQEKVTATFEKISDKRARVISASIKSADSKRQAFNSVSIESREVGKIKNISSLTFD